MIRKLLVLSLSNRAAIIIASIAVMVIGVVCFKLLKIEAYPDIADTNVVVIAKYPGRAAEEVEQQVTIPIERALNNVPQVIARRSRTVFGLAQVQLSFQDGTNDYFARQQVIERLANADLPDGVVPEMGPLTTAVGEIYRYVLETTPDITPIELRDLQDWVIVPALLQVPGIADVVTFGGPVKEFHVFTSPEKLRKYQLTLPDVLNAIEYNNLNTGGNIVERGGQGFAVRGIGAIRKEEDIGNIVITSLNGVPVFIRDVASVEVGPPPPSGILGYAIYHEGKNVNSGIEGIVSMRRGENPSEVLSALKARMDDLQQNEFPAGVKLTPIYDRTSLVDNTLDTVSHTLLEGVIIVILVLMIFLGNIRSALVVAFTIPFALLFAFILMKLNGIPANLLSLGAIDFGIIVDGACVMAAHLAHKFRHLSESERKTGIIKVTLNASQEVGREIFFSVLIIILAYMPILTMQRVEGKLFSPMALTLAFAVVGAMICALTVIPVFISFVYGKYLTSDIQENVPAWRKKIDLLSWMERKYKNALPGILKYHKQVVIGGFIIIGLSCSFIVKLGTEFLPPLDEGSIWMRVFLPAGSSIKETQTIAPIIRDVAAHHPQILSIVTQSGRNDDGTDPYPSNRTEVMMVLKDYKLWAQDTTKQELIGTLRREMRQALPSAFISFGQPIIDNVMETVTGSAADLAINIQGYDINKMRGMADTIRQIVKNMDGATDVGMEQEGPQAQLNIQINRKEAARYGINVADIQNIVEAAIGGKSVGSIYDRDRRYDIVVRYVPENRNSLDVIKSIQVPSASGELIPINQLATVRLLDGETNLYRANAKRLLIVKTNVQGRDQGGFVAEAREKIGKAINLQQGYSIDYGGQFENLQRAGKQLMIAIPLTVVIVLLVLFMLYKNLKYALLTLVCVFFALAGGIVALWLRDYHFNVSAGVGFVSLFGLSVMAGVLLISAINRERTLDNENLEFVISNASAGQLRSIMMMLIVAIIGLIPAAKSSGIGSDIQRPLATVIIGGLTSTLLFTPFMLTALYYWIEKKKKE
ncbi:efflux RND transporter permease subunit [Chryseolinea lacunae]|uniref:Efflux RND transporter permease subunit n=1 Tax=Chryseolinea lacunae TaxID=2801331 RepID=A0ABS1KMZ8_9BACT|nr:CusA/CzcA family heavy metal efflux RND transporter [Chryseolinea lacunae]MBL0740830.1 efflux RND transporter permease subunit [Chryseolinea lacunae]